MLLQKHVMNASLVTLNLILDYVQDGDICSYSPPIDNSGCCKKYKPSGTCEDCASGLALIDGKCEDIQIPGCIQKSSKGNCINCALDYEIFGGRCLKKIVGCAGYKGTG